MIDRKYSAYKRNIKIAPYLFLLPNVVIFGIFVIVPLLMGGYYSFTKFKGIGKPKWVGLDNYIKLFSDDKFKTVITNTFVFVLFAMILLYVTSLLLAYILSRPIKGKGLFRAAYYWPSMIAFVVVGVMWKWILNDSFGVLNILLQQFGKDPILILSDYKMARIATVLVRVWSRVGFYMIIFMGGLLSIPQSLYEAASIDGATAFQQFKKITMPQLKPTSLIVILLGMIDMFKTYALAANLTGGGPAGATTFIVQYIYETGFAKYRFGYASAMSIVLMLIIAVLATINYKAGSRE